MLKYIEEGAAVRFRSLKREEGRLYLTYYTDILIVPSIIPFC